LTLPARLTSHPVVLRGLASADAEEVARLAGDWEVARTTAAIPHPYSAEMAREFIARLSDEAARGVAWTYAVTRADDGVLVGCAALMDGSTARGNVGYWIGRPYWGLGYATAAARAVLSVGFGRLEHSTLTAMHLATNPASGRVLAKCGMTEGARTTLPHRDGAPQEFRTWSITREQWDRHQDAPCTPR
jgi:[ribosomal protein S5]-alanine N-acetyltransferase